MEFKYRLVQLRKELGLTQEEFAEKIGYTRTAVSAWEIGRNEPSNADMIKIATLFNVTTDYLVGKSYYRNYADFQEHENFALENITKLNGDEVKEIAYLLNYINHNNIKDIEDVDYFINKEITLFNSNNKLAMIKITSHLYHRYHGKIPKDLTAENIINEVTAEEWVNKNKYKEEKHKDGSISYSEKYYMCPVYGRISAGIPNWAEECIEGRIPIDPELMNIIDPEQCFFLKVNGESMNQLIKNGAFALIRKTDIVENGEVAAVLVNGYDATLKKFSKQGDLVILEPMSTDPSFNTQVYNKDTDIKVIGKYIGKMEMK